jgi:molybdopterin-synthase adenylyltransferase
MSQLTPSEIQRYKRHLLLREIGGQGQQALKAACVLVVGAGGLGAPILMYLAAAGVGTIGIVDDDTVSLDNLQRQIVHDTPRVGTAKVASAAETLKRLNPHVKVNMHQTRIDASNALELISGYDMVTDGSDNFATRYLVSDACYLARKTLVFAAVGPFDGYVTTLKRATAACSRLHRLAARLLIAPRSACSARSSAWSARWPQPKSSRRSQAQATRWPAAC